MPSRQSWIAVLATLVSAALFGAAFPPTSWRPLAWGALAPFLAAVARGPLRRALALTWLWCLAAAWAVGDWFPRSVAEYFGQPMLVAAALFFAVFTLMAAPYYMTAVAAWRLFARRFELALPLLGAAAWVTAELGRGRLFTGTAFFVGNPWGLLGYSQARTLPLLQIVSVTGIYGVSFALVATNAALAQLALACGAPSRRRRALFALPLAALPGAAAWVFGTLELRRADVEPATPSVPVAIAQGHVERSAQWRASDYGRNLDVYLRLTSEVTARDPVEVVFWPETALSFFLEHDELYRRAIAAPLAARGVQLVTGGPRIVGEEGDAARYTNSVFVVEPDGTVSARYDKQYLLPFAEYFPIGIDVLRRSFGRVRSFEHGTQVAPIATRAGSAGVLVCNETMLPEAARARVRAGASYLLNPSNDTWISDEKYAEQQFDIARARAVEERRWLIRVSTAGPSAIFDPWGRVALRTRSFERVAVAGRIEARAGWTPYARFGDAFAFACVALTGAAAAWARLRPAR